ncbi:MAG: hypothetical protein IPO92_13930 [Saprospiraceae bacterium]|nr:hypothetical protein [Saprospiraceae bacterium]
MKIKYILNLVILLFVLTDTTAQPVYTIQGMVTDTQNKGKDFALVTLLSAIDSTIIKGVH